MSDLGKYSYINVFDPWNICCNILRYLVGKEVVELSTWFMGFFPLVASILMGLWE